MSLRQDPPLVRCRSPAIPTKCSRSTAGALRGERGGPSRPSCAQDAQPGLVVIIRHAAGGRLAMRGRPTGVAPGCDTPRHIPPAGKELAATALPHPPPRAPRPFRGGVRRDRITKAVKRFLIAGTARRASRGSRPDPQGYRHSPGDHRLHGGSRSGTAYAGLSGQTTTVLGFRWNRPVRLGRETSTLRVRWFLYPGRERCSERSAAVWRGRPRPLPRTGIRTISLT